MNWSVEFTNELGSWRDELSETQQDSIAARAELLIEFGPQLPLPHSSNALSSRFGAMRELRLQSGGRPFRIFYAFDPRRMAMLLIGGDKTGDDRFYERFVPRADTLYEVHLYELSKDGLIE